MKKVFIVTVDCSISEAIKYALAGHAIIVPQEKNGKPSLELINFTQEEAKEFFSEISDMIEAKAELVFNR